MQKEVKQNFVGYFTFFYRRIGNKLFFTIALGFAISLLDGLGLSMFIPLLQYTGSNDGTKVDKNSMGALHYVIDLFGWAGIPLNIYTILAIMVLLFATKGGLNFWQSRTQIDLRLKFMKKVRFTLTDGIKQMSYEGFLKFDAGKIQNVLTTEVGKLLPAITTFLATIKAGVMLLTYVFLAILANWNFAILVSIGALISNLVFKNIFSSIKKASIGVSTKGNSFNSYLIQAIHYYKYLKATNKFSDFSLKLKSVINETEELNRKIGYNQALTSSLREPLIILIVAIVIIIQLKLGSPLGSIILSILLFYRALGNLAGVQTLWQTFMQSVGAISLVDSFTREVKVLKEDQKKELLPSIEKGITVKEASFAYGSKTVLDNINLEIIRHQTIALVGESGSGKTTLANLLTGLIKPIKGQLLIDDQQLEDFNFDSYRSRIGYISQEPVIFNDSIYNNVTFWAEPTAENLKRFWNVISKSSLTDFIAGLAEGEQTKLGDHGMLISGGQKQRISIARELYKDVEILILDEATSALDSETERFIQQSIEDLHGSYTIIVIAHRLSTIKNADRIYLLDNGRVLAQGGFDEILESSPKFQRMVALQEV